MKKKKSKSQGFKLVSESEESRFQYHCTNGLLINYIQIKQWFLTHVFPFDKQKI
jgi:hypothetical protein